jgi:phosphoribosylformylglycinamidine cyclo-ligase
MSVYREAGVDLDAHAAVVGRLGAIAAAASRPEVLAGVGPFAGAMRLPAGLEGRDPVLVASTDSVGTKVLLAAACGRYGEVGQDVVVHCANDVATSGAAPLFFLDYLAVHRLEAPAALAVLAGVAEACRAAGCALLGGETAQMPDLYREGTWDLAGTMVGIVPRDGLVVPRAEPGDAVVGIPSSGLHTNGYSLVRRVLAATGTDFAVAADMLLAPSRLYSGDVARLRAEGASLRGLAHITGGGLPGNLDRALSPRVDAVLDPGSWDRPPVFPWLQGLGGIAEEEMRRVFNLGVGFCVIVPAAEADAVCGLLHGARRIGEVVPGAGRVRFTG